MWIRSLLLCGGSGGYTSLFLCGGGGCGGYGYTSLLPDVGGVGYSSQHLSGGGVRYASLPSDDASGRHDPLFLHVFIRVGGGLSI